MSEAKIQSSIMQYLEANPKVHVWRTNSGTFRAKGFHVQCNIPGHSDIAGLIAPNGRGLYIEVKDKTKQSDKQILFQQNIEAYGGLYILAHSVDDVIEGLDEE